MTEISKTAMQIAFAERIKALRKMQNHSQTYLAQKLHVSKSSISNWEKGIRLPELDTLVKIANIYNVSCEYLLGSSKRPQPYTPEEKFIDKERYLDLNELCDEHQRMILEFYQFLRSK